MMLNRRADPGNQSQDHAGSNFVAVRETLNHLGWHLISHKLGALVLQKGGIAMDLVYNLFLFLSKYTQCVLIAHSTHSS